MCAGWKRVVALCLGLGAAATARAGSALLQHLDINVTDGRTEFVVSLDDASPYRMFTLSGPDRLVLDITSARLGASALPLPGGAGVVRQVRVANRPDGSVRIVLDLAANVDPQATMRRATGAAANNIIVALLTNAATLPVAPRQVASVPAEPASEPIDIPAKPDSTAPFAQPEIDARNAAPNDAPVAAAEFAPTRRAVPEEQAAHSSLVGRDIIIAVDAGHGGKDPGAHGPRGVLEKDVTLRVAQRLAEAINAEPGMRAVLTRSRDEFVPLRSRMERARAAQADLFVSVHADAVRNRDVQGASVYVLNEKGATDEAARRLAARENAADLIGGVSLGDKDRTLASVLMDLSQNASLSSSIEVADDILTELNRVGTVRKSRVMQAPFMVLKSPDVPSLLIETAYISNPEEERHLDSHEYRGRLAGAIFAGIRTYFYRNPPQGTMVAEIGRSRSGSERQHVIREGETLAAIATRYNISVRRIRDANQLNTDQVAVGQVLRIPPLTKT